MATAWLRKEQPELAAEKILDAADKAFVERGGVSAAGMVMIAELAGCPRGTLSVPYPLSTLRGARGKSLTER